MNIRPLKSSSRIQSEAGAALAELAIAIPFICILIAVVINFASILAQTQVMAEAVRHGARTAATRSNDAVNCGDIVNQAFVAANDYRRDYSSDATAGSPVSGSSVEEDWWSEPVVCLARREWDGLEERYVEVSVSTAGPTNCYFCFLNVFAYIPTTVSSVFKLEWGSCAGTAYAGIETSQTRICR